MRLRSSHRSRHEPRDARPRERHPARDLDLSAITFTDEEILADLVYPERPAGRSGRDR